jgi:hypothetical protein
MLRPQRQACATADTRRSSMARRAAVPFAWGRLGDWLMVRAPDIDSF